MKACVEWWDRCGICTSFHRRPNAEPPFKEHKLRHHTLVSGISPRSAVYGFFGCFFGSSQRNGSARGHPSGCRVGWLASFHLGRVKEIRSDGYEVMSADEIVCLVTLVENAFTTFINSVWGPRHGSAHTGYNAPSEHFISLDFELSGFRAFTCLDLAPYPRSPSPHFLGVLLFRASGLGFLALLVPCRCLPACLPCTRQYYQLLTTRVRIRCLSPILFSITVVRTLPGLAGRTLTRSSL
jgi:hypothetical protein